MFALFVAKRLPPAHRAGPAGDGAFTAFLVALFAEMYGIALTVYLLSGWLGSTCGPPTPAGTVQMI